MLTTIWLSYAAAYVTHSGRTVPSCSPTCAVFHRDNCTSNVKLAALDAIGTMSGTARRMPPHRVPTGIAGDQREPGLPRLARAGLVGVPLAATGLIVLEAPAAFENVVAIGSVDHVAEVTTAARFLGAVRDHGLGFAPLEAEEVAL